MSNINNNMNLWNKVSTTNPKYLKDVAVSGRKYTSIDAQYQYLQATEQFGSYGSNWGLKDIEITYQVIQDTTLANIKAIFFYPTGEFQTINSIKVAYKTNGYKGKDGYIKVDDEALKKLETNTVTKALSRLGFSADVFLGQFEDNKYTQDINYAFTQFQGKKLDSSKVLEIKKLIDSKNINMGSLLENYQISHLGQLNDKQYEDIKKKLGDI